MSRGVLAGAVLLAVFASAWHLEIIPAGFQDKMTSVITERIRQAADAVHERRTIYYSVSDVPAMPDAAIPRAALAAAVDRWESLNPGLRFVESAAPDVEIRWQAMPHSGHTGLATCSTTLGYASCVLEISLGAADCRGGFVQGDENMVGNILMHEIGHALGLGHTSEKGHLMYSAGHGAGRFDALGLAIPERLDELYVGQRALLSEQESVRGELDRAEADIGASRARYDILLERYTGLGQGMRSDAEYEAVREAYDLLIRQTGELNALIEEQNGLVSEYNRINADLACSPNFDAEPQS